MNYELLGMLSKINKSIKEQTEVLKLIAQELIKINVGKKDLGGKD